MSLRDQLGQAQEEIITFLDQYKKEQSKFSDANEWGSDVLERLIDFAKRGKMLRGMIVLSIRDFFNLDSSDFVRAAAAIELMHCTYLIQDDIMDDDRIRRSQKSMFAQYEEVAEQRGIKEKYLFGISLAICVSDISLFLANEILYTMQLDADQKEQLTRIITAKSVRTGLGQMQDVYFGFSDKIPSEEEVLAMYDAKTARYTFSLPLMVGALLAGSPNTVILVLDEIGSLIGKIFQIKDDELRLVGDDEIGKPIGSDILLGKKTPYYCLLLQEATEEELQELAHIQEAKKITREGLSFVRSLLDKYGVISRVSSQMNSLANEAKQKINLLAVPDSFKEFLTELVDFNLHRKT